MIPNMAYGFVQQIIAILNLCYYILKISMLIAKK